MAKKKYIEQKQIREISELVYDNILDDSKVVVAESPFLSKVVDAEEADKYLFKELTNKNFWKPVLKKWEIKDPKKASYELKNEFINKEIMPKIRVKWQTQGYELTFYDFNLEVPYKENEFVYILTGPNNLLVPHSDSYKSFNVYFAGQLIIKNLPIGIGYEEEPPFYYGDKNLNIYSKDSFNEMYIQGKTLYATNWHGGSEEYMYSPVTEQWLPVEEASKWTP